MTRLFLCILGVFIATLLSVGCDPEPRTTPAWLKQEWADREARAEKRRTCTHDFTSVGGIWGGLRCRHCGTHP